MHFKRRQGSAPNRAERVRVVAVGRRALRVLVVNHEQDSSDHLATLVCRWGHTARMARGGLVALCVAAQQRPEVVLLDLDSPLTDGCQFTRQLRLDRPKSPCFVIGVTVRSDDERRQECIAAGIDLLLIKPVESSVVETLLFLECARMHRLRPSTPVRIAAIGDRIWYAADDRLSAERAAGSALAASGSN